MIETRKYEISGSPKYLNDLEKLFGTIECWGNIGHSGHVLLFVDGDGSCRMRFDKKINGDIPEDFKFTYTAPHHELDETVECSCTVAVIYMD